MSGVARRQIPEDPARRAVLRCQNRAQKIVGRQRQIVTCWNCDRQHPEGSDGYIQVPGLLPLCRDERGCSSRAADAGRALVQAELGGGAS